MKFNYKIILLLFLCPYISHAQDVPDTGAIQTINLGEVVISVNKVEETKKTVAQQVQTFNAADISDLQAQTSADVVANSGHILVQKSQQGGGSPVLRGFEASRVLLVVDGVRMNNLIYRAGHLQNIITMDNASLDRVEVLYGPSSTIYGSDALGGVIHFYTKKPLFGMVGEKPDVRVNAFTRYGSVNNEMTGHVDVNIGGSRLASLTSFTYSDFDNLKSGENQNPFYEHPYGERPYYVDRINGKDSLVKNSDRFEQVASGYTQYDLMQKFAYRQSESITHKLNLQYSTSTDVPRYDRLTDLKSAEWYYGPQMRFLAAYDLNIAKQQSAFDNIHLGLNYQSIEESRHNRNFGSRYRSNRVENVSVIGANLDFQKIAGKHNIRFGADVQLNWLESTATRQDIEADTAGKLDTRYPDGDNTMNTMALYFSHTWKINDQLTVVDGIRGGYSSLHSTLVDTALLFNLPYTDIKQSTPVYSGSIGIINSPTDDLKLSLLVSTGFRVPNVDDLAKIFGSTPGRVVVPNPGLKPERSINYEIGITNVFNRKTRWENSIYYTDLKDVAVVDSFSYNGQDSILYDGVMSRVYANQNKTSAYIFGMSSDLISQLDEHFQMSIGLTTTYGRIKTDSSDVPLDHIPPFIARTSFKYTNNNFSALFFINYNGWKHLADYNMGGEDNPQYATPDGMPAWFTVNLHASCKVHKLITLQAGVDNMFDVEYRTFSSGINAPGRNIFGAIRFHY